MRGAARERLIDVPLESLPHLDTHTTAIAASPEQAWSALVAVTGSMTANRRGAAIARALGCAQTERRGAPGAVGSTVPGFVVARSVRPALLALMGEHRYARYALVLALTQTPAGRVELAAETRAEFTGRTGAAYRALVVGSRGHVAAARGLLRAVRRRAERG